MNGQLVAGEPEGDDIVGRGLIQVDARPTVRKVNLQDVLGD